MSAEEREPREVLSRRELNVFARRVGRRWKAVGVVLGLTPLDLDEIEIRHQLAGIQHQAYQMLEKWTQIAGYEAKMADAQAALEDVTTNGCAAPFPTVVEGMDPGSFIGRRNLLWWIKNYFFQDREPPRREFRMLLLHGLGGVGKTKLTYEFIRQNRLQYADGVYILNAESTASLRTSVGRYVLELEARTSPTRLEDWGTFMSLLATRPESLIVFDSAENWSVLDLQSDEPFLPYSLAKFSVHVIICSRNQFSERSIKYCEKKEVELLPLDESVELLRKHCPLTSDHDLQAAEELAGEQLVNGLPLGLVHAAAHINSRGIKVQEYVRKVKDKEESVKLMMTCSVGEFLHLFQLDFPKLIDELKTTFEIHKAADLGILSDADVEHLGLHGNIRRRFQMALQRVRKRLPNFPVWEMDIEVVRESRLSYKLLKCCALLAPSPIPVYLLHECYHQYGGSDHTFQKDVKLMTNLALLSPSANRTDSPLYYQMHRLVQDSICDLRFCEEEGEERAMVDTMSSCFLRHLPGRDDVVRGIRLNDHHLSDLVPHLSAMATLIRDLGLTEGSPEQLFELTRTVALTTKDLLWASELCAASVERAVCAEMAASCVTLRLIDQASCYYYMKDYAVCLQTVGKAKVYIAKLRAVDTRLAFSFELRTQFLAIASALCQGLMGRMWEISTEFGQICRLFVGTSNTLLAIANFYSNQFLEICLTLKQEFDQILHIYQRQYGNQVIVMAHTAWSHLGPSSLEETATSVADAVLEGGVSLTQDWGTFYQELKVPLKSFWRKLLNHFPPFASSQITVNYLRDFGEFLQAMEHFQEAELTFKKALELEQETLPENHTIIGDTQQQIGNCFVSLGRDAEAAECYREALRILKLSSLNSRVIAELMIRMAKALVGSEPDEARKWFEEAVSLHAEINDPAVLCAIKTDLAAFYCSQNEPFNALTALADADQVIIGSSSIGYGVNLQSIYNTGVHVRQALIKSRCFLKLSDYQSAVEHACSCLDPQTGIKLLQTVFPSIREIVGDMYMCLAQCFCETVVCEECISNCKAAIENYATCQSRKDHKILAAVALWTRSHLAGWEDPPPVLEVLPVLENLRKLEDINSAHVTALFEVIEFLEQTLGDHEGAQQARVAMDGLLKLEEDSRKQASQQGDGFSLPWESAAWMGVASSECSQHSGIEHSVPHSVERQDRQSGTVADRRREYEESSLDHPSGSENVSISVMDPETCSSILLSSGRMTGSGGGTNGSSLELPLITISKHSPTITPPPQQTAHGPSMSSTSTANEASSAAVNYSRRKGHISTVHPETLAVYLQNGCIQQPLYHIEITPSQES